MKRLPWFLSMLVACIITFSACSHRVVTVERVIHDSISIIDECHDTLIWIDSVWQNIFVKGDTVFSEKEKYRIVYRPKDVYIRTYESRIDSIPYPVEVPAKLTKKEQLQMKIGKAVLKYSNAAIALLFLVMCLYFTRGLRKK